MACVKAELNVSKSEKNPTIEGCIPYVATKRGVSDNTPRIVFVADPSSSTNTNVLYISGTSVTHSSVDYLKDNYDLRPMTKAESVTIYGTA